MTTPNSRKPTPKAQGPKPKADALAREVIASALDDTLVVEAAAGTGKTSCGWRETPCLDGLQKQSAFYRSAAFNLVILPRHQQLPSATLSPVRLHAA